jgi:hypothetical protein
VTEYEKQINKKINKPVNNIESNKNSSTNNQSNSNEVPNNTEENNSRIYDINITTLDSILKLITNKEYGFAIFEPDD